MKLNELTNEEIKTIMNGLSVLTMDRRFEGNAEEYLHCQIDEMSAFLLKERFNDDLEELAQFITKEEH